MATGVLVSVEKYRKTSYRPDRDYLDGEVVERNLGEFKHSRTQCEILLFLALQYPQLRKRLMPEQRVQVRSNRFRIPDICILAEGAPQEKVITTPPALCIEILAPEDTLTKIVDRIKDYFAMGVPVCWIIDLLAARVGLPLPAAWRKLWVACCAPRESKCRWPRLWSESIRGYSCDARFPQVSILGNIVRRAEKHSVNEN